MAATRHRLVEATVEIIAADGVRALTATAITQRAQLELHAVTRYFGSRDQLLVSAATAISRCRVLPVADPRDSAESPRDTLLRLAAAHRAFTLRSPERFAALLQLSSAALFTAPVLRPVLAARHGRVRATATTHLLQLQRAGSIGPGVDLPLIAAGFADAMTGIEICHLVDADPAARDAAYRELCVVVADRLSRTGRA